MTKYILIFIFFILILFPLKGLSNIISKNVEVDTIKIFLIKKDTTINYSGGTILIFNDQKDSLYLNLLWENFQFDMGKPGITPYYKLKNTAPIGIYKIIINYYNLVFPEYYEEIIHFKQDIISIDTQNKSLNYNQQECDSMMKTDSLVLINGFKGNPPSYSKFYGYYLKTNLLKADGEFKNGYLYNGIYYIYNCEGVLSRKCVFKNGKYFADGQ